MEDLFVPYELAIKLRELGFKSSDCFAFYNGKHIEWKIDDNNGLSYYDIYTNKDIGLCVSAPLWQQAFDWFRKKYSIHYTITYTGIYLAKYKIGYGSLYKLISRSEEYEDARLACLEKLIEVASTIKVEGKL